MTKNNNRYKEEIALESTEEIKTKIEACQYLKQQFHGNRVSRYIIEYKGYPIDLRLMSEKLVAFCASHSLLQEFLEILSIES